MTCLYSFLCLVVVKVSLVCAQVNIPVAPFNADGNVVSAVANSQAHNSGGSLVVNNFNIVVPDNLIVQFPSTWIPWQQFVANDFIGDEVMINGNIINGTAMAAQIIVARNLANIGQGYIESIDFATGSMKISGGPTIRINDPNAVFSVGNTDGKFEYKADDVSPSITSAGGFPMCIPRNSTDPLCPLTQRPAGKTFFTAVDPLVMAPFMPGDYIMFSGVPSGDNELLVYAINCPSVMINCADPVYIRLEDAKGGIFDGDPVDNEFGDFVFTGTMTDQRPTVEVFAQDVDPCTGVVTDRPVGSGFVLTLDEIRNKWEYRADTNAFANYTREYKLRTSSGTKVTKNGIVAGEYVTPVTEWVLPELLNVGRNPNPVPFDGFRQLTQGIYQDEYAFGRLKPWPAANTMGPAPVCRNNTATGNSTATPVLAPMTAIKQIPGSMVTMTAKMTNTDLTFANTKIAWTQISGPAVDITGNNTSTATFLAPAQGSTNATILRQFKITATNNLNTHAVGSAVLNVTTDTSVPDIVVIDSYTETHTKGGTIAVVAHSNYIIDSSAQLTLFEGTALAFAMTDLGHGQFSYQARSTPQPPSITVKSAHGGSATLINTTN